jgi:hypothetical protein
VDGLDHSLLKEHTMKMKSTLPLCTAALLSAFVVGASAQSTRQGAAADPAAAHLKNSPDAGAPESNNRLNEQRRMEQQQGSQSGGLQRQSGAARNPAAANIKGSPDAGAPESNNRLNEQRRMEQQQGSSSMGSTPSSRRDAARDPAAETQMRNSPDAGAPEAGQPNSRTGR